MSRNGKQKLGIFFAAMLISGASYGIGKTLHLKAGDFSTQQLKVMNQQLQTNDFAKEANSSHYIVQFSGQVTEGLKAELRSQGLEVLRYIPDDALLVRGDKSLIDSRSDVEVALPYSKIFKRSPNLEAVSVFNATQSSDVIITVAKSVEREEVMKDLDSLSTLKIVEDGDQWIRVRVQNNELSDLIGLDSVEWVEPHVPMQIHHMDLMSDEDEKEGQEEEKPKGDYTDLTGYENGTKIMNFEQAWNRGYTGEGQIIGMADTGLDSGSKETIHQDFQERVTDGQSFGLFSDSWKDPMGHGTHVAGSVLSRGTASSGNFKGGAYDASMVAQGMWSELFNNLTVPTEISRLFTGAYDKGARIHTNSWGSPRNPGSYDKNSMQVDKFMWENPEMLIIFAAGNSGVDKDKDGHIDPNSVGSPGTAKNVLTVGASENLVAVGGVQRKLGELLKGKAWPVEPLASDTLSDNPNGMAAFSSIGPTLDGRIKPDVVAPGTNVISNCSTVKDASPLWGKYNDDYCYSGGTSMSTPLVAGAAALVRQYLGDQYNMETPMAATVKAILMNSAFDMFPGQYGTGEGQELPKKAPNMNEGYGRVDVAQATRLEGEFFAKILEHEGLATGEEHSFELEASDLAVSCAEPGDNIAQMVDCALAGCSIESAESEEEDFCMAKKLKVTLVYTDAPAAPAASKTLVNNLDLEVQIGEQEWASQSKIDNSEQVHIEELPQDLEKVKVIVKGTNVPEGKDGKLPFSLVISKSM